MSQAQGCEKVSSENRRRATDCLCGRSLSDCGHLCVIISVCGCGVVWCVGVGGGGVPLEPELAGLEELVFASSEGVPSMPMWVRGGC